MEQKLKIGGRNFPFELTIAGFAVVEPAIGLKYPELFRIYFSMYDPANNELIQEKAEQLGLREQLAVFWAGLEGARRKYETRPEPYTMDEVSDLLHKAGGPNNPDVRNVVGTDFGRFALEYANIDPERFKEAMEKQEDTKKKKSGTGKKSNSKRSK